jgi:hypothetical protein
MKLRYPTQKISLLTRSRIISRNRGTFFEVKKLFRGEKVKNKKYAITKGRNIWVSSLRVYPIASIPITITKNFSTGSESTLFAIFVNCSASCSPKICPFELLWKFKCVLTFTPDRHQFM